MTAAVDWLKPAALWQENGLDFRQLDFFRPQLFEFQSDSFMEDFLAAVAQPQPTCLAAALPTATSTPLKLFQPAHGCFYLVSASLCCRLPGFPDREVQIDDEESVFFVVRRLLDGQEYGWAGSGEQKGWQPLNGQPRRLLPGEDRLPLFSALSGNGRSLQFGYLPVTSRDTSNVPAAQLTAGTTMTDVRLEDIGSRFLQPLSPLPGNPSSSMIDNTPDEAVITVSVYLLLDLWEFLFEHLEAVAVALRDKTSGPFSGPQATEQATLLTLLQGQLLDNGLTLAAALSAVAQAQTALNESGGGDLTALGFDEDYTLRNHNFNLDDIREAIGAALPTANQPPVRLPKLGVQPASHYMLRCVYERPQCDPPIVIVSQRSRPFQFAPYFDPDAPTRDIRIPLPTDVSVAGMRKFKKGVTFMMSDAMRKKVERITGREKSLIQDDPPTLNDEDGGGFAFICSFSIQIIFIVAFFLLLVFVIILDFVFWWMIFFKICLPIPKDWLPE